MLDEYLAHFVIQAVFDGQFFHHALPNALRHRFRRLALDLVSFDEPLHNFRGHMADIIPNEQHSKRVLYPVTLSRCKEKQFTGSPDKVQLTSGEFGVIAGKKTFVRLPYKQEVAGSSPALPTILGPGTSGPALRSHPARTLLSFQFCGAETGTFGIELPFFVA